MVEKLINLPPPYHKDPSCPLPSDLLEYALASYKPDWATQWDLTARAALLERTIPTHTGSCGFCATVADGYSQRLGAYGKQTIDAVCERARLDPVYAHDRSEEHTSELQSLRHLVCRLLLE